MNDLLALYGTTQPPVPFETITRGKVSLTLQGGALRHIRVDGVEIIRSVAFLLRDRDWGTIAPVLGTILRDDTAGLRLTIPMRFHAGDARLAVTLAITLGDAGLSITAEGLARGDLETNRAGFTVLHPIEGVAGAPARVTHADGSSETGHFPLQIDPWRPFMDIAALEHGAGGLRISCTFSGDVFEMEDQRQWGDASFKTYNRPLSLPWPYLLADGEELHQSVTISWAPDPGHARSAGDAHPTAAATCAGTGTGTCTCTGTVTGNAAPVAISAPTGLQKKRFPQMALVLTAGDAAHADQVIAAVTDIRPQRLLCHVDATLGPVASQIAALAALQARLPQPAFDLELICRFDGTQSPQAELADHARAVADAGLKLASVFVCPSVDRQSTPPGSDWPACPPLDEIHAAAAQVFADLPRGGGMASFFPELNRKRPPAEMLDFISHGLCPIVHAADDISVMETLEAVGHIARSARAIAGPRDYRLGPATIAMRHNPYGARTRPNPDHGRICMTHDDPRHRAQFGAAYALGLATALAPFDVAVWTPAEVLGPRGVAAGATAGAAQAWPIAGVLRALAALAGQPVCHAHIDGTIATLCVGTTRLRANLAAADRDGLPAFGWDAAQL